MNPPFLEEQIWESLRQIIPDRQKENLGNLQWVQRVRVEQGCAEVLLELPPEAAKNAKALEAQLEEALRKLSDITEIRIILTASRSQPLPRTIPGVKHVIAIASGKGGVGKSTTALNLALALAEHPLKIGLLDLDIYGPSIPHLLGQSEKPDSLDGKTLEPLQAHGITYMSMGLLMPPEKAAIWRGPMVHSAVQQMLYQVNWGALDLLLLDLPPGTGDVPLSLAQLLSLTGAVMVSTPQELALLDVRRAMEMFKKLGIPLLGLLENMSYFACSSCGTKAHVFHHHGAKDEAQRQGIPFLGEIPLAEAICQAGDEGKPLTADKLEPYRPLAKHLLELLV